MPHFARALRAAARLRLVRLLAVAVLAAAAFRSGCMVTIVDGNSMAPTYVAGDVVALNRLVGRGPGGLRPFGRIAPGDVIALQRPWGDGLLIKRVIAVPGQHILILNGRVHIDGELIDEPYVHGDPTTGTVDIYVLTGELFVLGDHRAISWDSRSWSLLPADRVAGRVEWRWWPFSGSADRP